MSNAFLRLAPEFTRLASPYCCDRWVSIYPHSQPMFWYKGAKVQDVSCRLHPLALILSAEGGLLLLCPWPRRHCLWVLILVPSSSLNTNKTPQIFRELMVEGGRYLASGESESRDNKGDIPPLTQLRHVTIIWVTASQSEGFKLLISQSEASLSE